VDSIVIGFYRDKKLRYAARVRAGFVPLTRRQAFERIKLLEIAKCPFVNLPEKDAGRWGQGLTAEKMKECVWVKPQVVAEVEFLEWTGADHLRHIKFVGLRDDKDPRTVVLENLIRFQSVSIGASRYSLSCKAMRASNSSTRAAMHLDPPAIWRSSAHLRSYRIEYQDRGYTAGTSQVAR
jgi:hypothetical protein